MSKAGQLGWRVLEGMRRAFHHLGRPSVEFVLPKVEALPAAQMRIYEPADHAACCEIYKLNEQGRFPEGHFDGFSKLLASETVPFLVIDDGARIIGFGGVHFHYHRQTESAHLCYGMIHPEYHRRGYGTVLLLSRIAMLPWAIEWYPLTLAPVPTSQSFYQRFGFQPVNQTTKPETNEESDTVYVMITSRNIRSCARELARHGVKLKARRLLPPAARRR